jgi:hypothetical protein
MTVRDRAPAPHQHARASDGTAALVKDIVRIQQLYRRSDAAGRHRPLPRQSRTRREISDRSGGWQLTKRRDCDQQLIARLHAINTPGDMSPLADPSYIFRWGQTNACRGQAFRQGPEDKGWYDRTQA